MSRASHARRAATAAGVGGGSLIGLGALAFGVLSAQVRVAKRRVGARTSAAPYVDGRYGTTRGTSLRLVFLGDSSATGFGATQPSLTPAALLARWLADASNRPVSLTNVADIGADSRALPAQVERALLLRPNLAVIMIGANDVTHRVRVTTSTRLLREGVAKLHDAGCEVIVATCPDLGTVRPLPQPLRWTGRRLSRRLAAAQAIATVEGGGRAVILGDLLGPEFDAHPDAMFSVDRFHPSDEGYAACAEALAPSVLAAVGLGTSEETAAGHPTGVALELAEAAAEASDIPGLEVIGATGDRVDGRATRAWLRWRLRAPRTEGDNPAGPAEDSSGSGQPSPDALIS